MELNKKMNKENLKTIQSWIDQCPDGGTRLDPCRNLAERTLAFKEQSHTLLGRGKQDFIQQPPPKTIFLSSLPAGRVLNVSTILR